MKKEHSTSQKDSKQSSNPGWLENLADEFKREGIQEIPEGALRFQDIKEKMGWGMRKTYKFINAQIKKGNMRVINVQVFSPDQDRLVRRVLYIPVEKN